MEEQLKQFYSQLPPELQEKIQILPPEKQQEVLMQLLAKYNNSQQNVDNSQQFALGGKPKSNYDLVQDSLANFMYSPDGKFFSNRQQYQDYQDFYYPKPVEDNVNQPIVNNYYIKKYKPRFINRFEEGGQTQGIPVEAERNENITVQDGQEPEVEGGYLEQQSHNPVTGQATYEIPDNEHNNSHGESGNGSSQEGVNMQLTEGDVINSNKTKIPTDFKVYGKNFKGKTFKDASDYLSKQETKIQDDFAEKVKEGKTDKVSDGALQIMLAKLGKNRNELNELQEQVLESKKQKETNESLKSGLAEYGKVVLEMNKAEHGFNSSLDRYLNYKVTDRPVLKAADGLTASMDKFSKFADKVTSNKNASLQDIMSAYNQSGLSFNPKESTAYYKPTFQPINGSQVVGDFKSKIAQKETGAYKNPYIAIAGIGEKEASTHSFEDLKSKAASSGLGKYQFIWSLHKNDIKRVTGISDPDQFRYNPQAQEKFMDWFRDNQLLPQATKIKQQYQIPLSIEKIMAGIHLEGVGNKEKGKGFLGKYFSGKLGESTMAGKFKNATTNTYMDKFENGGKIYADIGANLKKIYEKAMEKVNSGDLPIEDVKFLYEGLQNPEARDFTGVGTVTDLTKNLFGDGNNSWIPKENASDLNFYNYKNKNLKNPPSYQEFNDNLYNIDSNILPEEMHNTWANKSDSYLKAIGDFLQYYDNQNPTQINPVGEIKQDNSVVDNSEPIDLRSLNNRNRYLNREKDFGGEKPATEGRKSSEDSKADKKSIKDYLNYGLRESLPYLRNLALMNEDTINPILQQKSYQNLYDNMNTDYSIQSALNDSDRSTLTAMADERGNPSVRSARLAQIAANAIAAKAPLYTQKYNQEQQLQNQKTIGQSQYLNQWEDVNRGLKKQFEHEVLQTREVQRQQKNMAIDSMMNNYLRKQEENQAINLSLLETNYDWNPYTGKYEFNKEKAAQNFAEKKYLAKNKQSGNSKIIEGADGESYEVITPKSGKPIIRKIEKKYGGKVVKY